MRRWRQNYGDAIWRNILESMFDFHLQILIREFFIAMIITVINHRNKNSVIKIRKWNPHKHSNLRQKQRPRGLNDFIKELTEGEFL